MIETTDTDNHPVPYILDETEIAGELAMIIQENHNTGTGPLINYLGRWEGDGKLTTLILIRTAEVPEMDDFVDWYYELRDTSLEVDRSFTVVIDGRN